VQISGRQEQKVWNGPEDINDFTAIIKSDQKPIVTAMGFFSGISGAAFLCDIRHIVYNETGQE
jgi:hypothetical protein